MNHSNRTRGVFWAIFCTLLALFFIYTVLVSRLIATYMVRESEYPSGVTVIHASEEYQPLD
ncbi:MAG: hypothetical protein K6E81_09880 [Lachnospiraceae bacterium]|nr:hypothetical protein [Lachnospiraceae bacterium]